MVTLLFISRVFNTNRVMDRSCIYANRVSEEYVNGVCAFTRAAERDMLNKGAEYMYCPCIDCENLKMFNNQAQIQAHLIRRGFKKGYTRWTSHGEEQIIQ